MELKLRILLSKRKMHGGIHRKYPVLQAFISGFIVTTLTITHNVGARCQRSGLLSAPSLVLPTCTVSWKSDGCLWKRPFWKSSLYLFTGTSSAFATS